MSSRLVQLSDGVLVEVATQPGDEQPIAGGAAEKVAATVDAIGPLLKRVCTPITEACRHLAEVAPIEKTEIELGLSFEGEGNLYVTKAKAGANLVVKLTIGKGSVE